jgi:5S rRNA maturation endonuclease (ribonuclease M5)
MEAMMYQNLTENPAERIEKILLELGYNLNDRGKYWQTNAVYRNGDNRTALQIWKDTGIWKDFVANTTYQPFKKLIELSCQDDIRLKEFFEVIEDKNHCFIDVIKTPKMEADQFFSHDEVKTLLPHYQFYNNKKISDDILKTYRSGFAMSGKMNGRFVFPVFDENQKVVGLSGRHMLWKENSAFPKWKHLGRKANWIYPINLPSDIFSKTIEEKKEIILIEGIGDSLALSQQGLYNHLVVFGLEISSKQLSYLMSLSLNKIYISTNNDQDKADNRGLLAAIKIYLKLIKYFDINKVEIRLPVVKDFGEMLEKDISIDKWINKKVNKISQVEYILKELYNNKSDKKIISLLEDYLEQLNVERNTIRQQDQDA